MMKIRRKRSLGNACCGMSAILMLAIGAGCSVTQPSMQAHGAAGGSPQETLEKMRDYDRAGDFQSYVACMTDRGRGWLIAQMANGLLMEAYDQPVNPNAGSGAQALVEKYGFSDLVQQIRQLPAGSTQDDVYEYLADKYGPLLAEFLHDYKAINPPVFPASYFIDSIGPGSDRVALTLSNPQYAGTQFANVKPTVYFVHMDGKWLMDGGDAN